MTAAAVASRLSRGIAEHLARVVLDAELQPQPFEHIVLSGAFPLAVYAEMLRLLPADGLYRSLHHADATLPDGRSARLQFPLIGANVDRLRTEQREFWRAMMTGLLSREVLEAYRWKFTASLRLTRGRSGQEIRLRPYATLFRDVGGYKISIHPDSPRKAITTQFYLPADNSQEHLGTRFHSRREDGSFTLARSMRFSPNSGYAFAVTPHSYHSVAALAPADRPRNSLMIIINYDRGPVVEGIRLGQKYCRAVYDSLRGRYRVERGEGGYDV